MFTYRYIVNRVMSKFECGVSAVDQTKLIVSLLVNYAYYAGEIQYKYNYATSRIEICKRKGFKITFICLQLISLITSILGIGNLIWLKYTNQLHTRNPVHAYHTFMGSIIFFSLCCHWYNFLYANESISFINSTIQYFWMLESKLKW